MRDLDGRFRAQLAAAAERHVYAAGDVLSNNEGAFYLKAGSVEIFRGEDVVTRLGPRDGFGEDALLDAVPATYGARAVGIVEAWHLPRRRFLELLRQYPAIREPRRARSKPARFEPWRPQGSNRPELVAPQAVGAADDGAEPGPLRGKRDVPARDAAQTRAGHAWNAAALLFVCGTSESALRRGLPRGPPAAGSTGRTTGRRAPGHRRLSLALARRRFASQGLFSYRAFYGTAAITDNPARCSACAVPPAEASER